MSSIYSQDLKLAAVINPNPSDSLFFDEQSSASTTKTGTGTSPATSIDDGYFAVDDGTTGLGNSYNSRSIGMLCPVATATVGSFPMRMDTLVK